MYFSEISSLNHSLAKCERENILLQEEVKQLRLMSEVAEADIKQLQASVLREGELQNRCHELQKKMQGKRKWATSWKAAFFQKRVCLLASCRKGGLHPDPSFITFLVHCLCLFVLPPLEFSAIRMFSFLNKHNFVCMIAPLHLHNPC